MRLLNICRLLLIFLLSKGTDENDNVITRKATDDEKFAALAFKIMTDPFVGQLIFFRVYSGVVKSGWYRFESDQG